MLVITHGCVFKLICCIHLSVIWEEDTCTDKVYFFVFSYQSLQFLTLSPLELLVCPHKAALFTAMRYWGNTVNCWCHAIKEVLFIFAVHNVQNCPNAIFQIKHSLYINSPDSYHFLLHAPLCYLFQCTVYIKDSQRNGTVFLSALAGQGMFEYYCLMLHVRCLV